MAAATVSLSAHTATTSPRVWVSRYAVHASTPPAALLARPLFLYSAWMNYQNLRFRP